MSRTLTATALLLVIACATSCSQVPTADAHRPLKMIWGPNELEDGVSAFPTYQDLGAEVLQTQLSWRNVARRRPVRPTDPGDPAYAWPAAVDTAVREATRHGLRVALMVKQTPGWANGRRGPAQAPRRDRDFARFLTAAARRYRPVRHWMIWGEPQRADSFKPMRAGSKAGPARYARLLDSAYGALKAVNRRNLVIGGNTWSLGVVTPPQFLRFMRLPSGKPPRLDYYGHNPFSTRRPNIRKRPYYPGLRDMSDVDTLAAEVRRAYRGRRQRPRLWLSEFTVSSDRVNRAFDFFVSRESQAQWLTDAFEIARRERYIAAIGWYNLIDERGGSDGLTNGLLTASLERKPAYFAFKRALATTSSRSPSQR